MWKLASRSEEHTSELQSPCNLVCRLLLEKKKKKRQNRAVRRSRRFKRHRHADSRAASDAARIPPTAPQFDISRNLSSLSFFFFFNDTATTEIYTLSLHDALPIWISGPSCCTIARSASGTNSTAC